MFKSELICRLLKSPRTAVTIITLTVHMYELAPNLVQLWFSSNLVLNFIFSSTSNSSSESSKITAFKGRLWIYYHNHDHHCSCCCCFFFVQYVHVFCLGTECVIGLQVYCIPVHMYRRIILSVIFLCSRYFKATIT